MKAEHLRMIRFAVLKATDVDAETVKGRSRLREDVDARRMTAGLMAQSGVFNIREIAEAIRKDRTSAIYLIRTHKSVREGDKHYRLMSIVAEDYIAKRLSSEQDGPKLWAEKFMSIKLPPLKSCAI